MLQVALLGEQRFTLDGESLTGVLPRRAVEIVTNLALHPGQPQPRSHLAGVLWPDSTDSQALTNLRRELHNLRTVLGQSEPSIVSDARTTCWQPGPGNRCDLADFVQATADAYQSEKAGDQQLFMSLAADAVGSYGGMLLPGSAEEWVLEERDVLQRECVRLLDRLVALEEPVAISSALEHAERRLALEPMHEMSYQVLMRLQVAAGDRASAIQTYHRCVATLDRELGVGPDAATLALYTSLVGSVDEHAGQSAREGRRTSREPGLVGRERELAALLVWRAAPASDSPQLHLLRGEAGMGKTRLMREVAARAHANGAIVATARCYASQGRIALAPVAEWLGSAPMRAYQHRLAHEWAAEVERLLPPDARDRAGPPPSPMIDAWQRHHFFEGLARALLQPGSPTLLLLDDLQWCDAETLSWLPLFLDLAGDHPVQLLASVRDEQLPGHPALADALQDLRAAGRSIETELTALSTGATASLAQSVLGSTLSGQDAARWHEATGGIPLFVIETARSKNWQKPKATDVGHLPRVQAVLNARLQEVSAPAREVAGLAAAFGRAFPLDLLTEASDHPDDVIGAVDELWRRRIIRGQEAGTYDFTHDLLREAAYEQVSPPLRQLFHRRIAQAIELLAGGDTRTVAASLAEQYDRAHAPKGAIRSYAIAAEGASEVFAFGDAVRQYERALELLPQLAAGRDRDHLELRLLHAMSLPLNALEGYASPNLRDSLERSAVLAERLSERRLHLLTLVALFAVRFVQGDIRESYRIGQQALSLSSEGPDAAGQVHFALGGAAAELGRHMEAIGHFELAHQMAIDQPPSLVGTRPEVHARAWCAHPLWMLGRDDEAVHWADWAIARAEEVEQPYSLAVALAYATITHQLRRDVERSAQFAERTLELCTRYDFAYYREWGAVLSGWSIGGDTGIAQIERGLAGLRAQGAFARHPYYLSLLAEVLLDVGQVDRCRAVVDAALAAAGRRDDRWWTPELLRLKARAVGDEQAADLLKEARSVATAQGSLALLKRIDADCAGG